MDDAKGWLRCSTVGVAALMGIANVGFPLDQILDRIFDQIAPKQRQPVKELAGRVADTLASLEHSHGPETVQSALSTTTELLRDFGISDQTFVEFNLDASDAAEKILRHARFKPDEQIEIAPLCSRLLTAFYQSLSEDADIVAGLLPHIRRAILCRLDEIGSEQKALLSAFERLRAQVGEDRVDQIQRENHLTQAALTNMFCILHEQQVPAELLDAKLRKIAERHVELTERLHSFWESNDEPEVAECHERAARAIEAGDYHLADSLLEEAELIDDKALQKQQEVLDRRKLSKARTRSERSDLERTRLNYRKAASHLAEAAALLPSSEDELLIDYVTRRAAILFGAGSGIW